MKHLNYKLSKYDNSSIEFMRKINSHLSMTNEFFAGIRKRTVVHKGKVRQISSPQILETESEHFEAPLKLNFSDYVRTDTNRFIEAIFELIQDLILQKKKQFINNFRRITEAAGNNFDANGRTFWDIYPEILEKMYIRFGEDGKPSFEIRLNPKTYKSIMETPPTETQVQKIKDVLNEKRTQYFTHKKIRKLRI